MRVCEECGGAVKVMGNAKNHYTICIECGGPCDTISDDERRRERKPKRKRESDYE